MSIEDIDGVSVVRFDHPPVNALDLDLLDDVIVTMRGLDGPVVITGAGRCFSAGVDLPAIIDGGAEYTDRFMTSLSAAFLAVFDHPAPVVAAINGHAIAGGCVFAMAADIRLMSAGTIGLTELAVGAMFPMSALEICRYAMGTSVTQATLGAGTVDVSTAAALGWVDEVVTPEELLSRATALARELAEYAPARVRHDQAAATPARPGRDRRRHRNGRNRAGLLDVAGDSRPHGGLHEVTSLSQSIDLAWVR